MKPNIVADGRWMHEFSPGTQKKLRELRERIEAQYAEELSSAGLFRYLTLKWQISVEYRRERRKLLPSSQALFNTAH